jgi:hypothetical protein
MKLLRSWHLKNKILHNETIPAYVQEGIPRREEVVLKEIRRGELDLCRVDAAASFCRALLRREFL